jgi:hypothetical protein
VNTQKLDAMMNNRTTRARAARYIYEQAIKIVADDIWRREFSHWEVPSPLARPAIDLTKLAAPGTF